MIGTPRRGGLSPPPARQPEAETPALRAGPHPQPDLDHAIAELERTEGVGLNDDGVFGSRREGWRAHLPDACKEPFVPLLWLQVLELLDRVPKGSTAKFLENGTLPE